MVGGVDGPGDSLFAIGAAVRVVPFVPLFTEQRRFAEEPVHLLRVFARPEGQLHAQRHIRLGLAGIGILPLTVPQSCKAVAVSGGGRFLQNLLIGQRRTRRLGFFLSLLLFTGSDVGLVNPLQGTRRGLGYGIWCPRQLVLGHGEIPDTVIHLHPGGGVFVRALRLSALEEQVDAVSGGRELRIGWLLRDDGLRRFVELSGCGVIAVVDIHAHDPAACREYEAHAGISIAFHSFGGGPIVRPRRGIAGGRAFSGSRVKRHLFVPSVLIRDAPPADPLIQPFQFFGESHGITSWHCSSK